MKTASHYYLCKGPTYPWFILSQIRLCAGTSRGFLWASEHLILPKKVTSSFPRKVAGFFVFFLPERAVLKQAEAASRALVSSNHASNHFQSCLQSPPIKRANHGFIYLQTSATAGVQKWIPLQITGHSVCTEDPSWMKQSDLKNGAFQLSLFPFEPQVIKHWIIKRRKSGVWIHPGKH